MRFAFIIVSLTLITVALIMVRQQEMLLSHEARVLEDARPELERAVREERHRYCVEVPLHEIPTRAERAGLNFIDRGTPESAIARRPVEPRRAPYGLDGGGRTHP